MATYTVKILCPYCQADRVVKNGTRYGHQNYLCKICGKQFKDTGATNGHKVPADHIGAAIQDYYAGKSYKQIAETMAKEYDIPEPSKATIFEWVRDYTEKANDQVKGLELYTGDHWVADEMAVDVGGGKAWLWNVMDGETRFILATHLARERNADAARTVLRKALETAGKPPDYFFSDKLRSYRPALRDVLPDAEHFQSEGLTADINNNLSERLQGTFRDRIKTLRGLDTIKSGQRYLDGWVLNYNFFRGHHSLRNQTPASRAKAKPPFTEWADVVKDGSTPQPFLPMLRPNILRRDVSARPKAPGGQTLPTPKIRKVSAPKPKKAKAEWHGSPSRRSAVPRIVRRSASGATSKPRSRKSR